MQKSNKDKDSTMTRFWHPDRVSGGGIIKVSVIVPVFNTEDFLPKCLDSLVNQTLKDIEIICVNDGSVDNSLSILRDYAIKDERIKIINQENKKQGAARNAGMNVATGEYIGFVDSDDWVDKNYFEFLYKAVEKYNSDIALATNVRIGKNKFKKRLDIDFEKVSTTLQSKIDVCEQWKNECPTNKIYRRAFLERNGIDWPEGIYCEDKLFTIKAVYYANSIVSVPEVFYYYFENPNSTVNIYSRQHRKQFNIDKNNARRDVVCFLKHQNVDIRDKDFWYVKFQMNLFGIVPIYTLKQSTKTSIGYLFGFIPVYINGSKG